MAYLHDLLAGPRPGRSPTQLMDDFLQRFRQAWAGTFGRSRITRSSESDNNPLDQVDVWDEATPMQRVEQYGDITVPPDDCDVIFLRHGDSGACWSLHKARPAGVSKRGNRGLYSDENGTLVLLHGKGSSTPGAIEVRNPKGASIVIDKDGGVTVTAAAGKDVSVNGGTLAVARQSDAVVAAAGMVTWMSQVATYINTLVPNTVTPDAPPTFGTISGGATRFKG